MALFVQRTPTTLTSLGARCEMSPLRIVLSNWSLRKWVWQTFFKLLIVFEIWNFEYEYESKDRNETVKFKKQKVRISLIRYLTKTLKLI